MAANKFRVKARRELNIRWQRLEIKGETCPRCGSTESELEKAVRMLKKTLASRGFSVHLEKVSITKSRFDKNPRESNRICFNGLTLEELLDATSGSSKCCNVCGPKECRTVSISGKIYEAIPSSKIVEAGLIAASHT